MNKIILVSTVVAAVVFTGCTGGSTPTADVQGKVQDRMQEKATDKMLGKVGLPGIKKEKTTQEKIADVASGETSIEDAATDAAVDKAADMALNKVGI